MHGLAEQLLQPERGRHLARYLADGMELACALALLLEGLRLLDGKRCLVGHGREDALVVGAIGVGAVGLHREGADDRLAGHERHKERRAGRPLGDVGRAGRQRVHLFLEVTHHQGLLGVAHPVDQADAGAHAKGASRLGLAFAHPELDGIVVALEEAQVKDRRIDDPAGVLVEEPADGGDVELGLGHGAADLFERRQLRDTPVELELAFGPAPHQEEGADQGERQQEERDDQQGRPRQPAGAHGKRGGQQRGACQSGHQAAESGHDCPRGRRRSALVRHPGRAGRGVLNVQAGTFRAPGA